MKRKENNLIEEGEAVQPTVKRQPLLKPRPKRVLLVLGLFLTLFLVLAGRLVQFGLQHQEDLRLKASAQTRQALERPEIHDRNGQVLALDVPTSSLYADPQILLDIDETAEKLGSVLPRLDEDEVRKKLHTKRRFVWLRRYLTPDQRKAVFDLGLPGLYFLREPKRFYPVGRQIAHVIGTVDSDNKGLSGIERYIDVQLKETPGARDRQEPIRLSIDLRVQHVVVSELQKALGALQGEGGSRSHFGYPFGGSVGPDVFALL